MNISNKYGIPATTRKQNMLERYLQEVGTNSYQLAKQCSIDYYRLNRLEKMSQKELEQSMTINELTTIQETLNII